MSQIKFRHGRKFPPRITREDLYKRTNQKVEECGVNNHFQALFTDKIAKEVVGLKEYKYESVQPELKLKNDVSWRSAFTVVQHYLNDFQMKITLNTISTEAQKQKLPANEAILQKTNSVSFLGQLVDDSSNLPTFKDRVELFAKDENLPETSQANHSSKHSSPQKYTPKEQEKLFEPKNTKNNFNALPSNPIPTNERQNDIPQNLSNDNDDFEDIQIEDDDINNILDEPPKKSPVKPVNSNKNVVQEEKFSDEFEDSLNEEENSTNGKTITQTVFSKSDFSIKVDELQSDDGKQEAENKQLLQNLMTEQQPKAELESQKQNLDQVQNQTNNEVEEINSDFDADIPLDDSNSEGFASSQNQQNQQNQESNDKDEFVEDDFESDKNVHSDASPIKQPQSNSMANSQNSGAEKVEDFDDDDIDVNLDEDFEIDAEKEKKAEVNAKQQEAAKPPQNSNEEFDDFENTPSADDVDLENLPSSNNTPSKQPEVKKDDDLNHVSDDFDDYEVNIDDDFDEPPKSTSNVSENQTPVKTNKQEEEEEIEVFADDFDNENAKEVESDVVEVDIDDDIQEDEKPQSPKNNDVADIDNRFSQSDDFDDISDQFDIDGE